MNENTKPKTIVYIGNFQFPFGDAVAKRVYGIGCCLKKIGFDCYFIGTSKDVSLQDGISDDIEFEDFTYSSIHKPNNIFEHINYKSSLMATYKKLEKLSKTRDIQAVIYTGTICTAFTSGVISYCKKNKIKVIADSMDWLEIKTGNFLFDFLKQIDIDYEIKVLNRKADGILAISSFLANYYEGFNKKTTVIPPLSPYQRPSYEKVENKVVKIVYAGIPCRLGKELKSAQYFKDRFDLAVDLLFNAHKKGNDFLFHVYGFTKADYDIVFPKQREMVDELIKAGKMKFFGLLGESEVKKAIIDAHFTILLREANRTSMAGFPTKVSESITLGTPVITTDTSIIKRFLTDGNDSFFIDINCMDDALEKIIGILQLSSQSIEKMKEKTIQNKFFEPSTYVCQISDFLNDII